MAKFCTTDPCPNCDPVGHEHTFSMCAAGDHTLNDATMWHAACIDIKCPDGHYWYDNTMRVARCWSCETAGRTHDWCQTNPAPHYSHPEPLSPLQEQFMLTGEDDFMPILSLKEMLERITGTMHEPTHPNNWAWDPQQDMQSELIQ